ncbi:hypothetical protein BDN70DRAFT_412774 [Pholiota conissans]|uniref:DUF7770 domain-containing protein n=1 Tax=Pholiota conissans TaxID=109636 RepID=A0A9P5YPJ2_9AGAR|nr:hypothetical protein BDN70DRAFT_412774 [Pholiota conissans]
MRVRDIFECIFDQGGLDKYTFTDAGHGCRHFCATVLSHLSSAGIIEDAGVGETSSATRRMGRGFSERGCLCRGLGACFIERRSCCDCEDGKGIRVWCVNGRYIKLVPCSKRLLDVFRRRLE